MVEKIGILHPGQMGVSVAASAKNNGNKVYWVSEGRSLETRKRAASQELIEIKTLEEICGICSMLVSVCPPHAAEIQADNVLACGFQGLYLDANAISPQRVKRIGEKMAAQGTTFVDGGIIGGPAWRPGETWLYLSGKDASRIAACVARGPLETEVIGDEVGLASALKMCFAAYTKGSTALLSEILAAAEKLSVRPILEGQWDRGGGDFSIQTQQRVCRVTAKAWRFSGEMEEIADTMSLAGLPDGFHKAAAEIFQRMADFKGREDSPPLDEVLGVLLSQNPRESSMGKSQPG